MNSASIFLRWIVTALVDQVLCDLARKENTSADAQIDIFCKLVNLSVLTIYQTIRYQ